MKNRTGKDRLARISLMDLPGQYGIVKDDIIPAIIRVMESGRFIMGPDVGLFEEEFGSFVGASHCIGVASGTDALLYSLRILGIAKGDEVITVPNTFTATAEAIVLAGGTPVFVDIDPATLNMDPVMLKKAITRKTRAVIPVHLHGNPADMDAIFRLTRPRKIAVIEDAAQAHGATYKGATIGSLPSFSTCFSFHPVKNLGALGDGGAVTTEHSDVSRDLRLYINHGRTTHHEHLSVGTTGRLDTIHAAALRVKLKRMRDWLSRRRELAVRYRQLLPDTVRVPELTDGAESALHVFAIETPERDKLGAFLADQGIETGVHYPVPLHLQPAYRYLGYRKGAFPQAERSCAETLSLPFYPHMADETVEYICGKIGEYFA